jgi:hypothetical protein
MPAMNLLLGDACAPGTMPSSSRCCGWCTAWWHEAHVTSLSQSTPRTTSCSRLWQSAQTSRTAELMARTRCMSSGDRTYT